MKYIITCGGVYRKWQTPRQLLPFRGEPIVARTIRLLREYGVEDIVVAVKASDARRTVEAPDPPLLERLTLLDSSTLRLFFSEPLQPPLPLRTAWCSISPLLDITEVREVPPFFDAPILTHFFQNLNC